MAPIPPSSPRTTARTWRADGYWVTDQVQVVASLYRGARAAVSMGFLQDFHLLVPKGTAARVKAEIITRQPQLAPVRKGQRIGALRLTLDGKPLGDYPLVALHDVAVAGILGRGWDTIRLFFGQ